MKLKEFKKNNRYTYQHLADLFGISHRTAVYWCHLDHEYSRKDGYHIITRTNEVRRIKIKKEK